MAKKARGAGGTPATVALSAAGIAFEVRAYEHDPRAASYGLEAAEALDVDPARVFKTLLASLDGSLVVGIVPVTGQLDLKALARALGGSKAVMAEVAAAERATGYVAGGISPVGQKRRHPHGARRLGARARHDPGLGWTARLRPRARAGGPGGDHRSGDRHHRSLRPGQSVVTFRSPWTTSSSTQPLTPNADSGSRFLLTSGESPVRRTSQSSSALKLTKSSDWASSDSTTSE